MGPPAQQSTLAPGVKQPGAPRDEDYDMMTDMLGDKAGARGRAPVLSTISTSSSRADSPASRNLAVARQAALAEQAKDKKEREVAEKKKVEEARRLREEKKRAEDEARRRAEETAKALREEVVRKRAEERERRKAEMEAQQEELDRVRREGEDALRAQEAKHAAVVRQKEAELEKMRSAMKDAGDEGAGAGRRKAGAGGYDSDNSMDIEDDDDSGPRKPRRRHSWERPGRTIHPDFDDSIIETMDLHQKLMVNKGREQENDEAIKAIMLGGGDPADISLKRPIELTNSEWDALRNPVYWDTVKDLADRETTKDLLGQHADDAREERERKEKREEEQRREEREREKRMEELRKGKKRTRDVRSDDESETEGSRSKRPIWEMWKEDERPYAPNSRIKRPIPGIFLTTETHIGFPLNWCSDGNFDFLCDNWPRLPHKKIGAPDDYGFTRTATCLDVDLIINSADAKLSHALAEEVRPLRMVQPPDSALFREASVNFIELQSRRDPPGETFNRDWAVKHFDKWLSRPGLSDPDFFPHWIDLELDERNIRRNKREEFSDKFSADCDMKFEVLKMTLKVQKSVSAHVSPPRLTPSTPLSTMSPSRSGYRAGGSSAFSGPSSGAKRSFRGREDRAADAVCVVCGQAGHFASKHNPTHGTKIVDGRPLYSKRDGGDIVKASNPRTILCINWNARGGDALCNHGNERRHICSFCGAADHHALSWRCKATA